jgi:hypothetical protein
MHLSSVYTGMCLWALVYHTQPGSQEVELITNRFFRTEKKALKWFKRKKRAADFVEPEAVPFVGLSMILAPPYGGTGMQRDSKD